MSDIRDRIEALYFEFCEGMNTQDKIRYANTFCKDAVWEWTGHPPRHGREAIYQNALTGMEEKGMLWNYQIPPRFHILEHTEDTALVRAYTEERFNIRDKGGNYYLALYLDTCVIEEGRWRFKRRIADIVYTGSPDLDTGRVLFPAPTRIPDPIL